MFDDAFNVLVEKPIHGAASSALISFVENCIKKPPYVTASDDIGTFLKRILTLNKVKQGNAHFHHNVHLLLSEVYRKQGDFDKTMAHLKKGYALYPEYELIKKRAGYLSSTGLHKEAITILNDTFRLEKGIRQKLAMRIKQKELDKMKQNIRETMVNEGKVDSFLLK